MRTDLEAAYDHCERTARTEARNFYYAFRTLPSRKRRAIYAAYAFCRLCDDIADGGLPKDEKRRLLQETRRKLAPGGGSASDPVFTALHETAQAYGIPIRYLDKVIEGVQMDLDRARYETFQDLKRYCYLVASVVGLISIEIFGYTDPKAREYAIALGLAMQITNILRDVREDADRGRIYIPLDEMQRFGYTEHDLERGVVNEPFRNLMRYQAARARRYFDRGKQLIPLLPHDSRACPAMLHNVYSSILGRIEAAGFDVYSRRISLPTHEKFFLLAKTWAPHAFMSALSSIRQHPHERHD